MNLQNFEVRRYIMVCEVMNLTVYMDMLLLENFIVNKFLLNLTAHTVRIRSKEFNSTLGAILGCAYVCSLFLEGGCFLNSIIFKILVAFLMVFISFKKLDILFNLKTTIIFILYSMLLAGICIFIEINNNKYIECNMAIIDFSYKKLILAVMIIYMVIERIITYIRERNDISSFIYTVDITLKGCEKKVRAFLDTGNGLRESVTNLPVIIVEQDMFTEDEIKNYDTFYVPYSVINGGSNTLKAIRPECIKIHKKHTVEKRDALIAFCSNKLSSIGEYKALLSRGII